MKGILCCVAAALGTAAFAQVGDYVATDGGYQIEMSIRPKGVWTFQTRYLGRLNKRGSGRWAKQGANYRMALYVDGKPAKGPNTVSIATLSRDGRTLTSRNGKRVFVFRRVGR